MTHNPSPETLLAFALDAAWEAGRVTLGHFQTRLTAERKADNTPVTVADRQAESRLRDLIEQYWPDHGIIGEEFGEKPARSAYTWVLDPIDGTMSFVAGVPLYGTLLALLDGEQALLGVAHFPALDEMLYARRGGGCWWNGRRARVSSVANLTDAIALVSGLNYFGNKRDAWNRIVDATYFQRTWGDAYGYFLVATGRAELMLDPAMHLWDCAPLQVILEEAGGTFTDWHGRPGIHHGESIATNGVLLDPLLELIAADRPD